MDDLQAHRIVSALANGANPLTGEVFSADSPYQSPEIIRALYAAARLLERHIQHPSPPSAESKPSESTPETKPETRPDTKPPASQGAYPRSPASANAGKPWSAEEDRKLLAAFDAGKSLAEIARAHERTSGGVRARLEKHGRLEPSPATRWPAAKSQNANGANSMGT